MDICTKVSLIFLGISLFFFCVNIWFLIRFSKSYGEMVVALDDFKSFNISLTPATISYLANLAKRNNATFEETHAMAVAFGLTVLETRSE